MLDWSDAVRVGDIDPTNIFDSDDDCCLSRDGRWACTREDDHFGVHIAGDSELVMAIWR